MRNKYVGDVGDFAKYGLLRALCAADQNGSELTLGLVWYFVSEKGLEYLSERAKGRFGGCDHDLYGKLARMVQARSVSAVEQGDVLPPGTVFFADPVERSRREDWLDQAVDKMDDREVVFLDPDKRLIERLERRGDARLREYAYFDEVAKFAEHRGDRSVVIYHHLGRKEQHKDEIKDRLGRLRQQLPGRSPFALWFRSYSARAFLVIPAPAHEERLVGRACGFVGTWESHFELVPSKTELCSETRDASLRSA